MNLCTFIGHDYKIVNAAIVISNAFHGDLIVECQRCGKFLEMREGSTLWKEWVRRNRAYWNPEGSS